MPDLAPPIVGIDLGTTNCAVAWVDAVPGARTQVFPIPQLVAAREVGERPIDYLEFGVAQGASFRWWLQHATHPDSRFIGFDLFTGLPEDFGPVRAGSFDTRGRVPDIGDSRGRFVAGFFQETLGPFLEGSGLADRPEGRRLVLHMDADLYSSTLFALTRLAPLVRPGDLVLFDEFGVPMHEFKAWMEFSAAYQVDATLLAQANDWLQTAFRIEKLAR